MRSFIMGVVVLGVTSLAGVAFADSSHECQGNSCNGGGTTTSQSSSAAISVSDAKAKATGIGVGVGVGQGGAASASYEGYVGQSQSVNVEGTHFDRYAPPVAAPGLTSAGTGVCLGSVSIGLSGPMAGASFGITKVDKGCERRSGAALLYQMGYRDAAIRLLMLDPEVHDAIVGHDKPVALRTVTPEDHISVRYFPQYQGN